MRVRTVSALAEVLEVDAAHHKRPTEKMRRDAQFPSQKTRDTSSTGNDFVQTGMIKEGGLLLPDWKSKG